VAKIVLSGFDFASTHPHPQVLDLVSTLKSSDIFLVFFFWFFCVATFSSPASAPPTNQKHLSAFSLQGERKLLT
jgi:hypothetical protein